jgi:hypothetical protein
LRKIQKYAKYFNKYKNTPSLILKIQKYAFNYINTKIRQIFEWLISKGDGIPTRAAKQFNLPSGRRLLALLP